MNIVIFGAPGSGKGTQSLRIAEKYNLKHISTGDLLREHISKGTKLGKVADAFISQGLLIPDELMIEVLDEIFKENPKQALDGVIFDGFPRTIAQAEALETLLAKYGSHIHCVVGLEVDEEELIKRMLERGKTSGRSDDNIETIQKRLDVYHQQTQPLHDYYIAQGRFHAIDGNKDIEAIFAEIQTALDKHVSDKQ